MSREWRAKKRLRDLERKLEEKIKTVLDGITGINPVVKVEVSRILKGQLKEKKLNLEKLENLIRGKDKRTAIRLGLEAQGVKFELVSSRSVPQATDTNTQFQLRKGGKGTVFSELLRQGNPGLSDVRIFR